MTFKIKISRDKITLGPRDPDELVALVFADHLVSLGYRRTSNAYCRVARIDREDWLEVLAQQRKCSVAHFYNVDGSGVSDYHRDHYVRVFSRDKHTVASEVLRHIPSY